MNENKNKHCKNCTSVEECSPNCELFETYESVMHKTGWSTEQVDETFNAYCKAINQYAETDEFKEVLEKYFDKFVNVKDMAIGDSNCFTVADFE